MDNLLIIDAHCDTITKIMRTDEELYANSCHLDVARLKEYPSFVQFFAAFVSPEYCPGNAYTRCVDIIRKFEAEMANNKEHICHAKNYQQIIDATDNGKVAAVLTIENGGALEGSIAKLDKFYNLGVRSICLT
ncbi:MAG: dipeptidase, partial [Firmicutes bacterium]|nr:dipeptidase [Bacillota bacterium]